MQAIAKLVAAVFLGNWRRQLMALDSHSLPIDILRLIDGSPVLNDGGHLSLKTASSESGLSIDQLLRQSEKNQLQLHIRTSYLSGVHVPVDALPIDDPMTRSVDCTNAGENSRAVPAVINGLVPLGTDSQHIAASILVESQDHFTIVGFDAGDKLLFVPDESVEVKVEKFEVLAAEVEAIRQRLVRSVPAGKIQHIQERQKIASQDATVLAGKQSHKRFSEALKAYATTPSGIPGNVASVTEQKQKRYRF